MSNTNVAAFYIIGISTRTSNENNQAMQDIPLLWNRFLSEDIVQQIPNKIDSSIYCIYTEYESDHNRPYTALIGCRVTHLDAIPAGFVGHAFTGGKYEKVTIKGNINEGLVYKEWLNIWDRDLKRTYSADFEIYGEKAQNPADAEVDIFVAVE